MDWTSFPKKIKADTSVQEDVDSCVEVLEKSVEKHTLVLHNDDVNTFDWVIESLVKVCDHTPLQAEQCAFIVHFKGKCDVKSGTFDELKPKCSALLDRGLSAEIV